MCLLIIGAGGGLFLARRLMKFMQYGNPDPMCVRNRTGAGQDKGHPGEVPVRPQADGSRRGALCRQNPFRGVSCGW
jgi:hypothetical protein